MSDVNEHSNSSYQFIGMHFCFEEAKPAIDSDFVLSKKDRDILRELAQQTAEYATDPLNDVRKEQWKKMNTLQAEKPMVWFNEICWHEMNYEDELTIHTEHPFCRQIEAELRQQIYLWRHMPGDMVIEPVVYSPLAITNTGIGVLREMDIVKTDEANDIVSRHFIAAIKGEKDLEKIHYSEISHDEQLSMIIEDKYHEIFGGILSVQRRGAPGFWFAPWDDIVTLTGVQEALLDIAVRPDYIKHIVKKWVDMGLHVLDQYEELGLLSSNNYNLRVGSGAYSYTDELPQLTTGKDPIHASNLWGCCAAQIFSAVSPRMHEEFALQYERQWLSRFGLTYYGCCEPLHHKLKQLRSVKNLRKLSISSFANLEKAAEAIGKDYVISYKPSPAILASDRWDPQTVEADLRTNLQILKDCHVEMIMKDISTVRYKPQRLWDWVRIASKVCEEMAE